MYLVSNNRDSRYIKQNIEGNEELDKAGILKRL